MKMMMTMVMMILMMRTIDGYDNKITTVMNMMVTIKIAMLMAMMIDDGFDEDKHEESDLPNDHYYDPHYHHYDPHPLTCV